MIFSFMPLARIHIFLVLPNTNAITANTKNTKNKILAISMAEPAMLVNPNNAAIIATMKKIILGLVAAAMLTASKGEALVVCGSNDMNVQVVINAINELAHYPFRGKALVGDYYGFYSLWVGVYRVVYSIDKGRVLIEIICIGHRKDVYR